MTYLKKHRTLLTAILGICLLGVSILLDSLQSLSPNIYRAKSIIEYNLQNTETNVVKLIQSKELLGASDNYIKIKSILEQHDITNNFEIFIYKDNILKYWSTNAYIPDNIRKISESNLHFIKEGNGFFEVLHKESQDKRTNIYAIIPVYFQYSTTNKFLNNGFAWNHPFLKRFIISNKEAKKTIAIQNKEGDYLFSIRPSDQISSVYNPYLLFVEIAGLILLFWSFYQISRNLLIQRKYYHALTLVIFIATATDILFNGQQLFSITKASLLFSSNLYASTSLGATLGALLIRTFLLTWIFSLIRYLPIKAIPIKHRNWLFALPVFVFFLLIYTYQSVIQNSVISFNFYLINTLDKYTIVSLIIFGLCFSSLIFITKWIFEETLDDNYFFYVLLFIILGGGIGYFSGIFNGAIYTLFLTLWISTFFLYFHYEKTLFKENKKYRFLSNLILLSLISFISSVVIIYNTTQKDLEKRKYRMEELVSERDAGEEYNITGSEKQINTDNFIISYFKNPYLSSVNVENRLSAKYFKTLLKRYSIVYYCFNKEGKPLMGSSQKEFYKLNNIRFYSKAKKISKNYYYLSLKENGEKYLGFFPLYENSNLLGYLCIEFVPKIFSSYSAYPELLLKQKNYYDEEFDNFSYAIYNKRYLVKQRGDYEYQVSFNFPYKKNSEFSYLKSNGYNHIIYSNQEKQVVLSEKNQPALNTLSVFSYMVVFFLLFFILMDILGFSDRFWGENSIRNLIQGNTLQKQIQNSMIALVLFSLAIIGIVTMVYFQYQYNIYQNSRLLKKVNSVMKDFSQYYIEEYPTYGSATFEKVVQKKVKILSSIHALDINIYNTRGELVQTSQPEIFKRNLISNKIDPDAYLNLIIREKSKYIHDEHIGKLTYLSAYQPFRSNGKILGYFNFPYYGKQKSFQEDISYFLVALVNVYVVFLIAAAILAVILSRSITNSLKIISDNIRGVQLGKSNSFISWKNDDEIGLLVKQYNLMLAELEKSADLLAKSEREGAWREMAKQVAHEIKNPLTPMKLSIQHLQRALNDKSPDALELTEKITHRLIEQIDNLSNIASAFSDFAKMPQGNFEKIAIAPILESAVDLFREIEDTRVYVIYPEETSYVFGDKEQLMRVFINLIKNAIQAIPEYTQGRVDISIEEKDNSFIISIKDNGVGIANEKRTHIFEPNFTTKTSGTGLGLAISKNIIERMNGKIWFDTEENKYTIFYIQLPKQES